MPAGTVTGLRGARGGGERFRVWLDGAEFAVVSQKLVTAFGLTPGRTLTADERADLQRQAEAEEIRRRLIRLLETRDYSRAELARKLAKHDRTMVESAITALVQRGLVDDARYARMLVETRQQGSKPCGKARLAHDLRRRGIAVAIISEVLGGLDREDDVAAAREVARKAQARLRGCDALTRRRRLTGILGRRGFDGGIIARILREETGGDGDDD
ncbi:MAG TPA: regulatory protein RecX [bacterium]|nr:regulatory protein RecX [bacterium]